MHAQYGNCSIPTINVVYCSTLYVAILYLKLVSKIFSIWAILRRYSLKF